LGAAVSLLKLETPVQMRPLMESFHELDEAILDALPIGVYACDGEGLIVRVNRRAIQLWGGAPRLHDQAQRFCGAFRVESLEGDFTPPDKTPMAQAVLAGESFEQVEASGPQPGRKALGGSCKRSPAARR
jgi:PAS domain-containing protein